jgi:recombination protein RecR
MYPRSLQALIDAFRRLPGVGAKTAERYALSVSELDPRELEEFAAAFLNVKEKLHRCRICGNLSDEEECSICKDPARSHRQIFVVQSAKDILAMEKTGEYQGTYHVLNGLISSSKGFGAFTSSPRSLLDCWLSSSVIRASQDSTVYILSRTFWI